MAGLVVAAYGSYYRVGHDDPAPFESVLDTAVELGAPLVRIWAGRSGSAEADDAYWTDVVTESRRRSGGGRGGEAEVGRDRGAAGQGGEILCIVT